MANEITKSLVLRCKNGTYTFSGDTGTIQLNQTAIGEAGGVQVVGTTHEALSLGDVSTPGQGVFRNVDTTNYVELGLVVSSTFYPFAWIVPKDLANLVIPPGVTIYAKANTAPVKLKYTVLEK